MKEEINNNANKPNIYKQQNTNHKRKMKSNNKLEWKQEDIYLSSCELFKVRVDIWIEFGGVFKCKILA